jgi:hypothetical protein
MKSVKFVKQSVLVKKNKIEDAMNTIAHALKTDPSYRIGWYANLTFNIYDNSKGRISQDTAGNIADVILRNFFKA